jgi:glycosyltransferase involved in cell wall biosynthesis
MNSITALMPVRNGEKFLDELMPVILQMLSSEDECVIINDCSDDSTGQIIEKWVILDSRVRALRTSHGMEGLVSALNLGLEHARGEWIARFDVDDTYSLDRMIAQRRMIGKDVSLIFADYGIVTKNGKHLGFIPSAVLPSAMYLSLFAGNRSAHPIALFRRDYAIKCGGYKSADFPVEDLSLWLSLSQFGDVISVPQTLLNYRLSDNSITATNRKIQRKMKEAVVKRGHWHEHYSKSWDDLAQTISKYRGMSQAHARIYLHIRDLKLISKYLDLPFDKLSMRQRVSRITLMRASIASIQIVTWAAIRNLYRLLRFF